MNIFIYDYTFEGLLTCIFDAYFRKTFPDLLLKEGEPLPLFYDETFHVSTDERKAMRVWRGLEKKISHHALSALTYCWLSELPELSELLELPPQAARLRVMASASITERNFFILFILLI